MRVDLPGGWAELSDPADVTELQREPLMNLFIDSLQLQTDGRELTAAEQAEAVKLGLQLPNAVIVALVREWSFDLPISMDGVKQLPGRAHTELRRLCAGKESELMPDFSTNPAPDSPTGASAE